eukprot:CAMPEP_0170125822 /NCGR_PEP_ID=MMETSP0020_2-20130122/19269_1 /TAXON_ID=98059 /ORGANISM="Dinobryon sp., Strain UTEXLB2267" /LENGTH=40 /DNA_ID= /DNA_START= /DNA_END= /DNA_ORIENTATION=
MAVVANEGVQEGENDGVHVGQNVGKYAVMQVGVADGVCVG